MFEARLRVIYGDTDQMGVVYHANYFRYFELARCEYIRDRGRSYREIERDGARLPVVEAHAHYHSPARYDDVLVIRTRVQQLRRASLTFGYEVRRDGEPQVLCTGHTVHACLNAEGRPIRFPPALVDLLQERDPTPEPSPRSTGRGA
jgi:acyl-CoA thioester hydrolase